MERVKVGRTKGPGLFGRYGGVGAAGGGAGRERSEVLVDAVEMREEEVGDVEAQLRAEMEEV